MTKSKHRKFLNAIEAEEQHDRRVRKRELNKRVRRNSIQGGEAAYKKTPHKFNSLT